MATAIRRPTDRRSINARFDQSLNAAHMLRLSYQRTAAELQNQGVGSFDLIGRAYSTSVAENIVRLSENGAVGRRGFCESRLQIDGMRPSRRRRSRHRRYGCWMPSRAAARSGVAAAARWTSRPPPTSTTCAGAHSLRAGVLLEGGRYRSDDFSNYFGTYTFASLADYEAGRPSNYSRRIGDPAVQYSNLQVGDLRAGRLAPAQEPAAQLRAPLRSADARSRISRTSHRASALTWSPLKSGRTTFRGGAG